MDKAVILIPKKAVSCRDENLENIILYAKNQYYNINLHYNNIIYDMSNKYELITWDSIYLLYSIISNNIKLPENIIDIRLICACLGMANRHGQYSEDYWGLFSSCNFMSIHNKKISLKNILEFYKDIERSFPEHVFENAKKLASQITKFIIPVLYNSRLIKTNNQQFCNEVFPVFEPLGQSNGRFLCYPSNFIYQDKNEKEQYSAPRNEKLISFDISETNITISRYFFKFFSIPIIENLYEHFYNQYKLKKANIKPIISGYLFGESRINTVNKISKIKNVHNREIAHIYADLQSIIQRDRMLFEVSSILKKRGFVITLNKRIKHFDETELLKAWSHIIHGNESDIIINSLITIGKKYPNINIPIINGDEIIVSVNKEKVEEYKIDIKDIIERKGKLFNIRVKIKTGYNWKEVTD